MHAKLAALAPPGPSRGPFVALGSSGRLGAALRGLRRLTMPATMCGWPRNKTIYTCSECGGTSPKWLGKCPHCEAWNTLEESVAEPAAATRHRFQSLAKTAAGGHAGRDRRRRRRAHADRPGRARPRARRRHRAGGVVLIGGDPGIGKSTLLLQAVDALSAQHEGAVRDRRGKRRAGRAARAPPGPRRFARARAGRDPARDASWPRSRPRRRTSASSIRSRPSTPTSSPRPPARWPRCASARRS